MGSLVIKTFTKPDSEIRLRALVRRLQWESEALDNVPNVLATQRVIETETSAYLIRQWLQCSLYDRISTRPFLSEVEKLWISYQLLYALRAAHERHVPHGDLKCENVLVTSSLTVYITDFSSSFKPTYLPLDDPSDFSLFFDSSARRTCYIAPERFYESLADLPASSPPHPSMPSGLPNESYVQHLGLERSQHPITEAMDVFSLGCVLAELWRDGTPLFTLSQLFRYRKGELDLQPMLEEIPHAGIRALVHDMLQVDPGARPTLDSLLHGSQGTVFPESFYAILHLYLVDLQRRTGEEDEASGLHESTDERWQQARLMRLLEPDDRIEKLYEDWATLVRFFGDVPTSGQTQDVQLHSAIPRLSLPDCVPRIHVKSDNEVLVVLSVLLANVRHAQRASTKFHAMELLLHVVWGWLTDEARFDRVLPYFASLLEDPSPRVRAMAMHGLATLFECVSQISPSNDGVLHDFVWPHVAPLVSDPSEHVRTTTVSCLARLVTEALRLAHTQASDSFEQDVHSLRLFVRDQVALFVTDASPQVRRALLTHSLTWGLLMGPEYVQSELLSHVLTYLNDPDAELRKAVFTAMVDLEPMISPHALEQYMHPVLVQAMGDGDDLVVVAALRSLPCLLRRLRRGTLWELLQYVASLLAYPNTWIREASVGVLVAAVDCGESEMAERWMRIYMLLRPYLRCDIATCTTLSIWSHLRDPVAPAVLHACIAGASHPSSTLATFWRAHAVAVVTDEDTMHQAVRDHMDTIVRPPTVPPPTTIAPSTDDERAMLARLHSLGMDMTHDPRNLAALWWYIERRGNAPSRSTRAPPSTSLEGVSQQTIFFTPRNVPMVVPSAMSVRMAQDRMQHRGVQAPVATPVNEKRSDEAGFVLSPSRPGTPPPPPPASHARPSRAPSMQDDAASISDRSLKLPFLSAPSIAQTSTSLITAHAERASTERITEPLGHAPAASTTLSAGMGSTYEGVDPYIHAHLEAAYEHGLKMPATVSEPVSTWPTAALPVRRAPVSNRRPQGHLIAYFSEHTAAITCVAVASDHVFFVSGSDDGTVKIWDTTRLEKNVTSRSRLTYPAHHAPLTCVCVLEGTHCVVSTARDGSIHVWGVTIHVSQTLPRYTRPQVLGRKKLEEGEYVTSLQQDVRGAVPTVLLGTNTGRLHVWDIRTMRILSTLAQPRAWGAITCMAIDREHHWVCACTSQGRVALWDLRFQLRAQTWAVGDGTPAQIRACTLHPTRPRCVLVAWEAAVPQMTCLDLEQGTMDSVWHVGSMESDATPAVGTLCTPITEDTDDHVNTAALVAMLAQDVSASATTMTDGIWTVVASVDGYTSSPSQSSEAPCGYVITGGSDRIVRFWDLGRAEHSTAWGCDVRGEFSLTSQGSLQHYHHAVQLPTDAPLHTPLHIHEQAKAVHAGTTSMQAQQHTITALGYLEVPFRCMIVADVAGTLRVWE
ncbi:Serine/threonine-protein kinase [Malassezia pachydermatis]